MSKKYILILSILAVAIFALGVHLATAGQVEIQIGDSTISFLPLVMTSKAADGPPGVLYVFSSTAQVDGSSGGSLPDGRSNMGSICFSEDPEAHFCHMEEINSSWETGVFFSNYFYTSWVDSRTESSWADGTVNCGGWRGNSSSGLGSTITLSGGNNYEESCDTLLNVACCKRIP